MVQVKMSKSPVEPLSAVESGSQSHYFQLPRKLPKRKSRFKRSDGSTSSDTTSSFIKRQVKVFFLSKQIDAHLCQ
ncbi:hypothetical protein AMECASPLE_028703 [Ameca splendens]|uniref:Uncharacterized protein n=1 Tax=Ameca splendens TaxID=208324 RepID=A0ABV1ABV0_9TELE